MLPVKFRWIPVSGFRREVVKGLIQSEARSAILFVRPAWKNTNFVDLFKNLRIYILLYVKCHWIPFNGFRGEMENVLATDQSGHLGFQIRPKYEKILLLRCVHHLKPDWINIVDHMRIFGTEPSSVILYKTNVKVEKWCPNSASTSKIQKEWCNKPIK